MSRYLQLEDGVSTTVPNKKVWRLACCDCGLVHRVAIVALKQRKGSLLGLAVARDKRATAARRREMKKRK